MRAGACGGAGANRDERQAPTPTAPLHADTTRREALARHVARHIVHTPRLHATFTGPTRRALRSPNSRLKPAAAASVGLAARAARCRPVPAARASSTIPCWPGLQPQSQSRPHHAPQSSHQPSIPHPNPARPRPPAQVLGVILPDLKNRLDCSTGDEVQFWYQSPPTLRRTTSTP